MDLVIDNGWLKVYDNVLSDKQCLELMKFPNSEFINQPFPDGSKGYRTSQQRWLTKGTEIENNIDSVVYLVTLLDFLNGRVDKFKRIK